MESTNNKELGQKIINCLTVENVKGDGNKLTFKITRFLTAKSIQPLPHVGEGVFLLDPACRHLLKFLQM